MQETFIEQFHGLLEGPLADQAVETLAAGIDRHRLTFGDRPICNVLRPCLISASRYETIRAGSTLVLSALSKMSRAICADSGLLRRLDLTPAEEEIVRIDPGFDAPDTSGRLDAFIGSDGEFRFVEYNADSPGGLLFGDVLSEIFMEMDVVREFSRNHPLRRIPVRPLILDALIESYEEWSGGASGYWPNIAIVDWKDVRTRSEFEVCRQYFESRGCPTRIVDPNDLDYRDGRLRAGDFEIDIVYKRIVTTEFIEHCGLTHPLAAAARDRAVCVVNSFRVQALSKKILFALLEEPEFSHLFTTEEIGAVQRHIPWTRRLIEGATTWRGRRVELIDCVLRHRDELVLKPNGDYGGRGVTLGWECSDEDWERAIGEALGAAFIVQERVEISSEIFPVLTPDGIAFESRYLDLDPYTWRGQRVEGAGVRLSSSALLNVTAGGGSAVPMLVIDE